MRSRCNSRQPVIAADRRRSAPRSAVRGDVAALGSLRKRRAGDTQSLRCSAKALCGLRRIGLEGGVVPDTLAVFRQ